MNATTMTIPAIRNESPAAVTEILLYGSIGSDGITAVSLLEKLQANPNASISLRINSPGGSVFEGLAIYNALRARKSPVTVTVDGMAASIASIIAMAGRPILMNKSAYLMIHDPTGMVVGGADEMRETADLLDKLRRTLADIYAARTGKSVTAMLDMMREERWFTADEAKAEGLVDHVIPDTAASLAASARRFNLGAFAKVPPQVWNKFGGGYTANVPQVRVETQIIGGHVVTKAVAPPAPVKAAAAAPPSAADVERDRLRKQTDDLMAGRVSWADLKRRAVRHAQDKFETEAAVTRAAWRGNEGAYVRKHADIYLGLRKAD